MNKIIACLVLVLLTVSCASLQKKEASNIPTVSYVFAYQDNYTVITTTDDIVIHITNTQGKHLIPPVFEPTGNKFLYEDTTSDKKSSRFVISAIRIVHKDLSQDIIKVNDRIDKTWVVKLMYPYVLINEGSK